MSMKNPSDPSGIELATLQLVRQCLNQLHHRLQQGARYFTSYNDTPKIRGSWELSLAEDFSGLHQRCFLTIINSAECLYIWRLFGMWQDNRYECSTPWRWPRSAGSFALSNGHTVSRYARKCTVILGPSEKHGLPCAIFHGTHERSESPCANIFTKFHPNQTKNIYIKKRGQN
jgi:hypothetical protein